MAEITDQATLNIMNRKAQFLLAMQATMGIVTKATVVFPLSRTTHYQWMKDDPEYREAINEIDESNLDLAENTVVTAMKSGDLKAATFFLSKKGSKRGYGTKVEVEGDLAIVWKEEKSYKTEE